MKNVIFFFSLFMTTIAGAQTNQSFRIALAEQIDQLTANDELKVEYNKKGCWGSYEGGSMTFLVIDDQVALKLTNQNSNDSVAQSSTTRYKKSELVDRLLTVQEKVKDENNTAIGNFINYNILLNGISQGMFSATLEPDQVVNKVQINPNFTDFFRPALGKKGILINN